MKCKKPSKKTRFWDVFLLRYVQRYLYKDEKDDVISTTEKILNYCL
ncbi:hypothetical protein LINGRAHAP2_LOCUS5013 [Linum grandiflorum]